MQPPTPRCINLYLSKNNDHNFHRWKKNRGARFYCRNPTSTRWNQLHQSILIKDSQNPRMNEKLLKSPCNACLLPRTDWIVQCAPFTLGKSNNIILTFKSQTIPRVPHLPVSNLIVFLLKYPHNGSFDHKTDTVDVRQWNQIASIQSTYLVLTSYCYVLWRSVILHTIHAQSPRKSNLVWINIKRYNLKHHPNFNFQRKHFNRSRVEYSNWEKENTSNFNYLLQPKCIMFLMPLKNWTLTRPTEGLV